MGRSGPCIMQIHSAQSGEGEGKGQRRIFSVWIFLVLPWDMNFISQRKVLQDHVVGKSELAWRSDRASLRTWAPKGASEKQVGTEFLNAGSPVSPVSWRWMEFECERPTCWNEGNQGIGVWEKVGRLMLRCSKNSGVYTDGPWRHYANWNETEKDAGCMITYTWK